MGPVTAQLLDMLGYDPDDGVPELGDLGLGLNLGLGPGLELGPVEKGEDGDGEDGNLAAGDQLAVGAVIAARVGARRVAVARLGSGRLVVVDDECPHDGGRISDGFVDGEQLVCARHGWMLEARNGRCERACKLRE